MINFVTVQSVRQPPFQGNRNCLFWQYPRHQAFGWEQFLVGQLSVENLGQESKDVHGLNQHTIGSLSEKFY